MGNHEYKYQRYRGHHLKELETGKKNPMGFGPNRMRMYESLDKNDFDYIKSMPLYIRIDNLTLLHAGITNDIDLETAKRKKLESVLYIRHLNPEGKWISLKQPEVDARHWSEVYDGNQGLIVYGHDDFDEVKLNAHAIGIDTGCVYGNKLTAIIFDDTVEPRHSYRLVDVPAKADYFTRQKDEI